MEIRWSKFSLEGEKAKSRLAPSILRETMSGAASFVRIRHTRRGAGASFYVNIHFSAESRTWTSAYLTVSSYLKCPSITSGPSNDAATARQSAGCARTCILRRLYSPQIASTNPEPRTVLIKAD
jgi:hypothetical protein